jgi:HD superfamily phosphohydrolase
VTEISHQIADRSDTSAIEQELQGLVGASAWGARLSYGDELRIEFGDEIEYQHPQLVGVRRGEWSLSARASAWTIENRGMIVASSEAPSASDSDLAALDDRPVLGVNVTYPRLALVLSFDGGTRLQIIADTEDDDRVALWEVERPDGSVLIVRSHTEWRLERASEPVVPFRRQEWPVDELAGALAAAYSEEGATEYWEFEHSEVVRRLEALAAELGDRYEDPVVLGVGGSGIVLRLDDRQLNQQPVALKFPRPVPTKADLMSAMMDKEIAHLGSLRHRSLVRIHGARRVGMVGSEFPYYVMDYVDGYNSSQFFSVRRPDDRSTIAIVEAVLDALAYMHAWDVIHLDIKPSNILVSEDGLPVIADLGTAKHLGNDDQMTVVAATYGWADPELVDLLDKDPSDENRAKGEVRRLVLKKSWDLYAFGKTLLQWIGVDPRSGRDVREAADLTPYSRKYLLLLAARMIGERAEPWLETRVGLDRALLGELVITNAAVALRDVQKLSGRVSLEAVVPELREHGAGKLQVGSGEALTFTPRVGRILTHPALRRLGTISQLGLVSRVYPTATHTRLEHSLGTMHNACRFVLSLAGDRYSPLFRQIMNDDDIAALLVTALVHDIGQFPLAHDLEELAPQLFDHKALTLAILRGERALKKAGARRIALPDWTDVLDQWDVTPERVIAILEAKPDKTDARLKDRLLRSIIDGPVDADKLDYLVRDSARLGVPYGHGIDIERILDSITTVLEPRASAPALASIGVHEKGRVAAEFVAMARNAMFAQVYWHHTVRSAKAMLGRAVMRLVGLLQNERERNKFRTEFEELVLSLPASLYIDAEQVLTPRLFDADARIGNSDRVALALSAVDPTLSPTDAAVLLFLEAWLRDRSAVEAELLADVLERRLYKRLFVYSFDRSPDEGVMIADAWDKSPAFRRERLLRWLDGRTADRVEEAATSHRTTAVFLGGGAERIRQRVEAGRPLLLLDVPGGRPGSDVALHFVLETQRRTLRKDTRAVGDSQASEIWQDFGRDMRQRAGKVRVYCHPDHIEAVEAAVTRDEFVKLFRQALGEIPT